MLDNFKKKRKYKQGDTYAVHTGTYAGELLIFIEEAPSDYMFLVIPTMENRAIPKNIFQHARNTGIIKFVETAPQYVIDTSVAQYKKNEQGN